MEKRMEEPAALALGVGVSAREYKRFLLGEENSLVVELWDDNYETQIETVDGNIILNSEEMPMRFYGCFWYNGGNFPYTPNKNLKFIQLTFGHGSQLYWIDEVKPVVFKRMSIGPDNHYVEDPEGDACIWHMVYTLRKAEVE